METDHVFIFLSVIATTTKAPVTTTSSVAPVTTKGPKEVGPVTTPIACSYWSEWINEDDPKDGDKEFKSVEQLRRMGFCLHGTVKEIECRDVVKDRLYSQTGNQGVVCSLEQGLSCIQSRQGKGGRCVDYKIRYYCHCEEETTTKPVPTTRTAAPVTTTSTSAPITSSKAPLTTAAVPVTTTKTPVTTTKAPATTTAVPLAPTEEVVLTTTAGPEPGILI